MSQRFCGNCGTELRLNERFCPKCGKKNTEGAANSRYDDDLTRRLERIEVEKKIGAEKEPNNTPRDYIYEPPRVENYLDPRFENQGPVINAQSRANRAGNMYPNTGLRILAYVIDMILIVVIVEVLISLFMRDIIIPDITSIPDDPNAWTAEDEALLEEAMAVVTNLLTIYSLLITTVTFLYNLIMHLSSARATIGQLILRFKLADAETLGRVSPGKVIILSLLKSIFIMLVFDVLIGSSRREPGMARMSNHLTRTVMIRNQFLDIHQNPTTPDQNQ